MTAQEALDRILEVDGTKVYEAVIMHPPNEGRNSDEESGDEDEANVEHLHGNQLLAAVEMTTSERLEENVEIHVPSKKKRKIKCQRKKGM